MDANFNFIEPVLERVEAYGATTLELIKLKTIDKTAKVTTSLITRLMLILVFSLFVLTLNIAIALWLGDELGKSYYGFLIVAAFYGTLGIVLSIYVPVIKKSINNSIILQMLN